MSHDHYVTLILIGSNRLEGKFVLTVKCKNEKICECEQNGFGIGDDDYYSHFGPNCSLHVELR